MTFDRFYCEEADLAEVIIHITEKDLLSKKDNNWSTNKLVVLSEYGHMTSCDLTVMAQVQFILHTTWPKLVPVRTVC